MYYNNKFKKIKKFRLVRIFKTSLERMTTDNHKVVIKADKPPSNEHPGRFNAPTINEAAVIITNDGHYSRDIVLHKRCSNIQRISETHRSYDALQYPMIFWDGQDSYSINIKQWNPNTNRCTNKNVTSMQFYSHRIMIRAENNFLLQYRQLFNQFLTDMYAKIEAERLQFLRQNQSTLRAEQYIHLRDAMNNDGMI